MRSRVVRALRVLAGSPAAPVRPPADSVPTGGALTGNQRASASTSCQYIADGQIAVFDPERSFAWAVSGADVTKHRDYFVAHVQDRTDPCQQFLRLYFGVEPYGEARLQEATTRFSFSLQVLRQLLPAQNGVWADVGSLGYDALYVQHYWPDVLMHLMTFEGALMTVDDKGFHYLTSFDTPLPHVHLKKCDVEHDDMPIPTGTVDVVTAWETLEHFKFGPQKFVMEANRVLKPGGLVFLTTPNSTSAAALVNIFKGQHPAECREYSRNASYGRIHPLEYDYGQMRYLFQMNGFDIISQSSMTFTPPTEHDFCAMEAAREFQARLGLDPTVHFGKKWVVVARKRETIGEFTYPDNLFA